MPTGLPPEEFYRAAGEVERKVRALHQAYKDALDERKALVDEAKTRTDIEINRTAEAMDLDRRRLTQIHNNDKLNGYQRKRLREQPVRDHPEVGLTTPIRKPS